MYASAYHAPGMTDPPRPVPVFPAGARAASGGGVLRALTILVVLIVAIPVALILAAVGIVGLLVLLGLALVNRLIAGVRGLGPRRDGRENVRVIRRDEPR